MLPTHAYRPRTRIANARGELSRRNQSSGAVMSLEGGATRCGLVVVTVRDLECPVSIEGVGLLIQFPREREFESLRCRNFFLAVAMRGHSSLPDPSLPVNHPIVRLGFLMMRKSATFSDF